MVVDWGHGTAGARREGASGASGVPQIHPDFRLCPPGFGGQVVGIHLRALTAYGVVGIFGGRWLEERNGKWIGGNFSRVVLRRWLWG